MDVSRRTSAADVCDKGNIELCVKAAIIGANDQSTGDEG